MISLSALRVQLLESYLLNAYDMGIENVYLSKKEVECLTHAIQGKSAKHIAIEMGLSYRTVEKHIENIKSKMNASSIKELIFKIFIH